MPEPYLRVSWNILAVFLENSVIDRQKLRCNQSIVASSQLGRFYVKSQKILMNEAKIGSVDMSRRTFGFYCSDLHRVFLADPVIEDNRCFQNEKGNTCVAIVCATLGIALMGCEWTCVTYTYSAWVEVTYVWAREDRMEKPNNFFVQTGGLTMFVCDIASNICPFRTMPTQYVV